MQGRGAGFRSDELKADEAFMKQLHHVLMDVHLEEGCLVCPKSGRRFPINNGIPNLLLHEDEL